VELFLQSIILYILAYFAEYLLLLIMVIKSIYDYLYLLFTLMRLLMSFLIIMNLIPLEIFKLALLEYLLMILLLHDLMYVYQVNPMPIKLLF